LRNQTKFLERIKQNIFLCFEEYFLRFDWKYSTHNLFKNVRRNGFVGIRIEEGGSRGKGGLKLCEEQEQSIGLPHHVIDTPPAQTTKL